MTGPRLRVTRNHSRGNWSFGFGRSCWPLPKPKGMVMYVLRVLWWNVIVERDL